MEEFKRTSPPQVGVKGADLANNRAVEATASAKTSPRNARVAEVPVSGTITANAQETMPFDVQEAKKLDLKADKVITNTNSPLMGEETPQFDGSVGQNQEQIL